MTIDKAVLDAVELLNSHPDFKVIRRVSANNLLKDSSGTELLKGIIVDTETTGINPDQDAVIELGMILFEFDVSTGNVYNVLQVFDELQDPGFPIPPESTEVHGITDSMVKGKKIDNEVVEGFLEGVQIVIAHNARFDRIFLEKQFPIFETLPWACTFAQIDWTGEGIGSAKLDYIAYQYGLFYDAHRAEVDCYALLEILQKQLPKSNALVLKSLLLSLKQKTYNVAALNSPFETKDSLKAKGYRWNGDKKCWHVNLNGEIEIMAEIEWLKENVYRGKSAKIEIEVFNCLTRFSNRPGNRVFREI